MIRLSYAVIAIMIVLGAEPRGGVPRLAQTDAYVKIAAAYVNSYQNQLTQLMADERSTQKILVQRPLDRESPTSRQTKSDVFFLFASANREWMAIRDVKEIDGKQVNGGPDLAAQLANIPAGTVASTFKSYNSRFNIGRIFRNFNEPILALMVLDDSFRSGVVFELRKRSLDHGVEVATLGFREVGAQTIIRDLMLRGAPSEGELTIETGTGVVRRASLRTTVDEVKIELSTTFGRDPDFNLWLPRTFTESYERGLDIADPKIRLRSTESYERIFCQSTYSGFRKFLTSGRVKKQSRENGR